MLGSCLRGLGAAVAHTPAYVIGSFVMELR